LTSPNELSPTVVAMVCELRRTYPRWGAQRIAHELTLRGVEAPPSRSSVYRILVRHGLVATQQQNHKRKYRRWQRDAPMHCGRSTSWAGCSLPMVVSASWSPASTTMRGSS
jgi:hypothetical protein